MDSKLVLVLNCGSSSLKFSVINPLTGDEKVSGLAEKFFLEDARIKWKINNVKKESDLGSKAAHNEALKFINDIIFHELPELKEQIVAIGHRIVHGGDKFTKSTILTEQVLKDIEDAIKFAPLHNPAGIIGIKAALELFPKIKDKNVVVFDTAYHQSMPETAYLYAIPYEFYTKHKIRRYGMHGTSHHFIALESAKLLKKDVNHTNIISCHLGNGGSVTAIVNGKCVDTSMGLTPLEGIVMGTRSGDIDPSIIFYMYNTLHMSMQEIDDTLNKKSGLLGLTGVSNDCRYAEDNYTEDMRAHVALDLYTYRLAKKIGAYLVNFKNLPDAIVFTGGIGENSAHIREMTVDYLKVFGYTIDQDRNAAARFGTPGVISIDNTPLLMVIPTNEELMIAKDAATLCFN